MVYIWPRIGASGATFEGKIRKPKSKKAPLIISHITWFVLQSSAQHATTEALAKVTKRWSSSYATNLFTCENLHRQVWRIPHACRMTMERRDARAPRDSCKFQKRSARFRRGPTWSTGSTEVRKSKYHTAEHCCQHIWKLKVPPQYKLIILKRNSCFNANHKLSSTRWTTP